jgi:hypothetical protein
MPETKTVFSPADAQRGRSAVHGGQHGVVTAAKTAHLRSEVKSLAVCLSRRWHPWRPPIVSPKIQRVACTDRYPGTGPVLLGLERQPRYLRVALRVDQVAAAQKQRKLPEAHLDEHVNVRAPRPGSRAAG